MTTPSFLEQVQIRYTIPEDSGPLQEWLHEPAIIPWFPIEEGDEAEINDAVARWIYYSKYKSSLTATFEGEVVGIATFYPQPYKKLKHQAQLSIIVGTNWRGRGVGEKLLNHLIHLAKTHFGIKLLHLEVYEGNPAIHLYQRLGFLEFGRQSHWIIEKDGTPRARIFMERFV